MLLSNIYYCTKSYIEDGMHAFYQLITAQSNVLRNIFVWFTLSTCSSLSVYILQCQQEMSFTQTNDKA